MVLIAADRPVGEAARFRRLAENANSIRDLAALFTRTMQPFGIVSYAVGHLRGGGRPITMLMTTWPSAWMEFYAINGLIAIDPIVLDSVSSAEPFTWEEAKARHGGRADHLFAAARRFGFDAGFAVPVHGPGDARGVVALAAKRLRITPADRSLVIEMCRACYVVARRIHDRESRPIKLPPREREALSLVAQGFDDAAIGAAMGITRTSAHVYVERAKRRLGATTRAHAVAMAMSEQLI